MGLRSFLSPFGGNTMLVDQLIGDAYPVVKFVADNMEDVKAVGSALRASTIGEPFLIQRALLSHGATGVLGSTVVIDFENLDVELSGILGSLVRITGNDGFIYTEGSGIFTYKIDANGLHLTLKADAPAGAAEAIVEWLLIYGEPV